MITAKESQETADKRNLKAIDVAVTKVLNQIDEAIKNASSTGKYEWIFNHDKFVGMVWQKETTRDTIFSHIEDDLLKSGYTIYKSGGKNNAYWKISWKTP